MFDEEGSHYWILAILFVAVVLVISGLYFLGIFKGDVIPEPPLNVQIEQIGRSLRVSWSPSISSNVVGYNIYRSRQVGVIGNRLNSELIAINEYVDYSLLEDGTYFYMVKAVSETEKEDEKFNQVSFYFDTQPPRDSKVLINKGEEFTNNIKVVLNLESFGSYMCKYKNDNQEWSEFSPYATIKNWELLDEEGTRIVYYQCKDRNENMGPIVADFIILDKTHPEIEFVKHLETYYLEKKDIVFSFNIEDNFPNVLFCSVKIDNILKEEKNVSFSNESEFLSFNIGKYEIGNYSVLVDCKDTAGNSNKIIKEIFVVPEGEYRSKEINVSINKGAEKTNDRDVILNITSKKAVECRYRNELRSWSGWEPHLEIVNWTLSSSEGLKTVYVECKDKNNISLGMNWDTIMYETDSSTSGTPSYSRPPTNLNILINRGDAYTNNLKVRLSLSAENAEECRYKNEGEIEWTKWEDYRSSKFWDLEGGSERGEGTHEIFYQCKNKFGESTIVSAEIIYDITPPEGQVILTGEAISNGRIKLKWTVISRETDLLFNIYRGRTPLDISFLRTVSGNEWIDTNTVNERGYLYYIKLKDRAGNEGIEKSDSVFIVADSEKPKISFYSPRNNERFDTTEVWINFDVKDNLADYVSCSYTAGSGKKDLGLFSTAKSYNREIELSPSSRRIGDETITIYLTCEDEAGNEETVSVNVVYEHEEISPTPSEPEVPRPPEV